MEAARQHKRAENSDYTQPLERLTVSRLMVACPRAGEHRGPESILSQPRVGLVRFGGADAGEAGEGRHPTSALKKITSASGRGYRPASLLRETPLAAGVNCGSGVVSAAPLPTHRY